MSQNIQTEFKFTVGTLLHSTSAQMESYMRQFYEAFGLTTPQAMVLLHLHRCGRGKISEVACNLHMTNSNLSSICRRLERDGLISRTRDTQDQRIVWITLTETCRDHLCRLEKKIDEQYLNNLASVSPEDREIILAGLTKLNSLLAACNECDCHSK